MEKMKAIVIKDHFESTVGRAYHASNEIPEIRVFGGITLNRYIGGLNPLAVEAALALGAKQIWMPTIDARNHMEFFGPSGFYRTKEEEESPKTSLGATISALRDPVRARAQAGISLLENSELSEETKKVIELVVEYDAIIGTSHISKKEALALTKYASSIGGEKILITHPYYRVPNYSLDELQGLVDEGATVEFCAAIAYPLISDSSIDRVAQSIERLGARNCILAGDTGAPYIPSTPEGFRSFLQCIHDQGISLKDIDTMTIENPHRLLNL
jgi:hypothetical protein